MSEIKSEEERELARRQAHARVWELARQQGVEPVRRVEDLYGDFWPEEESVDDFLSWLRTVRQENKLREVPE
jgi:erythromycin esterase-like protein